MRARILLIDDDADVRGMLRLILEGVGHHVVEAADGAEGLRVQAENPAELVLCDLFMPGKEGLETIRDLRRRHPTLRIIAMSGGSARIPGDYLVPAEHLGAFKTLRKPFDLKPQTVLAAVEEALTRAQSHDAPNM